VSVGPFCGLVTAIRYALQFTAEKVAA